MTGPRILFVADAGPEIGGGHVMRCLTLAEALAARGAHCAFMVPPEVAAILDAFGGPQTKRIETISGAPEALAAAVPAGGFDAFVFDSYRFDASAHRAMTGGRPSLVIDNLLRPIDCDLLMEPDPGRDPEDWRTLAPARARLLLGPDFALVRPAFARLRPATLARRREQGPVRRVLVSMGLTDVGAITARLVHRMAPRLDEATLDVVVGSGAASLPSLQALAARDRRVRVLTDVRDMASLMAEADLAVGAGGATIWERCALGLATVLVILAENQATVGRWLQQAGATETVDAQAASFEGQFDRAFTGLMRSAERRARLSQTAAGLCDGLGAERVADAFLEIVAARG